MPEAAPLLITAAINGAETRREDNPSLPLTPEEVAAEVERCERAGAGLIHLHARYPDGRATQDMDVYRDYFAAIREVSMIPVQFSTGGAIGMDLEERITPLCLRPEMATVTLGTCNFGAGIFVNDEAMIRETLARMKQFGVRPELEIFEVGMLDTALRLAEEGVLRGPQHVDFVLGVPGAMAARASHLHYMVPLLPEGWTWSVAGIGRWELPMAAEAIALGGQVRVGLEDNIYLKKGVLADGSSQLVEAVVALAAEAGRAPMTPDEARDFLRVPEARFPSG